MKDASRNAGPKKESAETPPPGAGEETAREAAPAQSAMEKLRSLLRKYRGMILYVFFGGCTTVVNWAVYYLCYNLLHVPNVPSTVAAWVLAVAFAFVTNKLWVFESKSWKADVLLHELWTFLAARVLTGLLDVLIMYVAVDVLQGNGNLWKLLSNVVVVILNYVASKWFIFNKK